MDERIEQVKSELKAVADDAAATFGSLSETQLNWKPAADSWSIAQCLDHLIKTDGQFDPEFLSIASGTRKNTTWQSISPFSGMMGRFLVKTLDNDAKKAKAPSKDIVPPSEIEAGIVDRFRSHIETVATGIEACSGVDRKKTILSSPFLRVLTYSLDDALTVLVAHHRRHVRQAKRVMANDSFPK